MRIISSGLNFQGFNDILYPLAFALVATVLLPNKSGTILRTTQVVGKSVKIADLIVYLFSATMPFQVIVEMITAVFDKVLHKVVILYLNGFHPFFSFMFSSVNVSIT